MLGSKEGFTKAQEDGHNHDGLQPTQHSLKNVRHNTAADKKSLGKQLHEMPVIDHMKKEEDGLQCDGRSPRLSQIQRQARFKSNILVQEGTGGCFQGRRARLTQIRHQARTKIDSQLQEQNCTAAPARITRLSQLQRQACSRSNSMVGEAINGGASRPFQTSDEHRRREAIIAEIFGEEQSFPEGKAT